MSFSATVTLQNIRPDNTGNQFLVPFQVAIVTGTYPAGGVKLGLVALSGIPVDSSVPTFVSANSEANPPSGYHWVYNAGTDKLQAYVGQASGAADAEFSGTIAADTVKGIAFYVRS